MRIQNQIAEADVVVGELRVKVSSNVMVKLRTYGVGGARRRSDPIWEELHLTTQLTCCEHQWFDRGDTLHIRCHRMLESYWLLNHRPYQGNVASIRLSIYASYGIIHAKPHANIFISWFPLERLATTSIPRTLALRSNYINLGLTMHKSKFLSILAHNYHSWMEVGRNTSEKRSRWRFRVVVTSRALEFRMTVHHMFLLPRDFNHAARYYILIPSMPVILNDSDCAISWEPCNMYTPPPVVLHLCFIHI